MVGAKAESCGRRSYLEVVAGGLNVGVELQQRFGNRVDVEVVLYQALIGPGQFAVPGGETQLCCLLLLQSGSNVTGAPLVDGYSAPTCTAR